MEFARALCHYCCVALGFFAFMYIPSAKNAHGSEIIVALFTVSFVYIASYVVFAIVRSLKNRKKNKEKNYDSMFKK
jgi:hypothetical protein